MLQYVNGFFVFVRTYVLYVIPRTSDLTVYCTVGYQKSIGDLATLRIIVYYEH